MSVHKGWRQPRVQGKRSKRQRRNIQKLERKAVAGILIFVILVLTGAVVIYLFKPELFWTVNKHRHE